MIYEDDNVDCRITVVNVDWEEEQEIILTVMPPVTNVLCHGLWKWQTLSARNQMVQVSYYYTTDWTASLSRTINGRTSSAQWIVGVPPDRRSINFGYVLFPGTGDSMELRSG